MGLRAKTYSYLIDDSSEDKNTDDSKKCAIKRKHKFENYKKWLEATQLENKINHLEKNEINIDSIKKLIKNSQKAINNIKTQQNFTSESHGVFTKEINKIALSSDNDKRIKSTDQ